MGDDPFTNIYLRFCCALLIIQRNCLYYHIMGKDRSCRNWGCTPPPPPTPRNSKYNCCIAQTNIFKKRVCVNSEQLYIIE